MSDKPPYKLVIKLSGTRPDALNAAVRRLDELCGDHDQVGELKTAVTIEIWKEEDVLAIRDGIEAFLDSKRLIIAGEVTLTSPIIRKRAPIPAPEPIPTPMEAYLQEMEQAEETGEPIITPALTPPLQLAAPVDAEEGSFTILEDQPEQVAAL